MTRIQALQEFRQVMLPFDFAPMRRYPPFLYGMPPAARSRK